MSLNVSVSLLKRRDEVMNELIARFSGPPTTIRSTLPLLVFQISRSAALSCASVSVVPAGIPEPGEKRLVAMNDAMPRIVRRTVLLPCELAAGITPLITQFSRSRISSRRRWFFW